MLYIYTIYIYIHIYQVGLRVKIRGALTVGPINTLLWITRKQDKDGIMVQCHWQYWSAPFISCDVFHMWGNRRGRVQPGSQETWGRSSVIPWKLKLGTSHQIQRHTLRSSLFLTEAFIILSSPGWLPSLFHRTITRTVWSPSLVEFLLLWPLSEIWGYSCWEVSPVFLCVYSLASRKSRPYISILHLS